MKHGPLARAVIATALLTSAACSFASKPTLKAPASPAASSQTTTHPTGSFTLRRGQGFDASGAFASLMTCDSPHDYSPALSFANVPTGTTQLALSMVDLHNRKIHWLQVGIPAKASGLKAHTLTPGARELRNDLGEATYDGPCPPPGSTHQYRLTLYALPDALPASFGDNTSPAQTLRELQSHSNAVAVLIASYSRH